MSRTKRFRNQMKMICVCVCVCVFMCVSLSLLVVCKCFLAVLTSDLKHTHTHIHTVTGAVLGGTCLCTVLPNQATGSRFSSGSVCVCVCVCSLSLWFMWNRLVFDGKARPQCVCVCVGALDIVLHLYSIMAVAGGWNKVQSEGRKLELPSSKNNKC